MTTIHVFENSYYIGKDKSVIKKAIRSEELEIPEGFVPSVANGVLTLVKEDEVM